VVNKPPLDWRLHSQSSHIKNFVSSETSMLCFNFRQYSSIEFFGCRSIFLHTGVQNCCSSRLATLSYRVLMLPKLTFSMLDGVLTSLAIVAKGNVKKLSMISMKSLPPWANKTLFFSSSIRILSEICVDMIKWILALEQLIMSRKYDDVIFFSHRVYIYIKKFVIH